MKQYLDIGPAVRLLCEQQNITLDVFAVRAELGRREVLYVKSGCYQPMLGGLKQAAAALDVTLSDLLTLAVKLNESSTESEASA